ncbi:MAG: DNA-formamidopyrimidine glycosylase family protein, partial [Planctomycetota bacterium]
MKTEKQKSRKSRKLEIGVWRVAWGVRGKLPGGYLPGVPELPEVECVRRTLAARMVGRRVKRVELLRADVLQPMGGMRRGGGKAENQKSWKAG